MKTWVIIVIVILVLIAAAAILGMRIWKKINFKPYFKSVDLSSVSLNDIPNLLIQGTSKEIKAVVGADITNENNFSIPFSNLKIKLLYNGNTIAETSEELKNTSFVLPSKKDGGMLPISDAINIIFDTSSLQILKTKLTGGKPIINYSVGMNISGIPIPTIENTFTW